MSNFTIGKLNWQGNSRRLSFGVAIFLGLILFLPLLSRVSTAQQPRLLTAELLVEADMDDIDDDATKIMNAIRYCQLLTRLQIRMTKDYKAYLDEIGVDFDSEIGDGLTWKQTFALTDQQVSHFQSRTAKYGAMVLVELNRRIEETDDELLRELLTDLRNRYLQLIAASKALRNLLNDFSEQVVNQELKIELPDNQLSDMMRDSGEDNRVNLYPVNNLISPFDALAEQNLVEQVGKDSAAGKELARFRALHTALKLQEQKIPESFDHFKFYRCTNKAVTDDQPVQVQSVFDADFKPIQLNALTLVGTPARKNDEPMHDPRAHLAWIQIDVERQEPSREVLLENQFGIVLLETSDEPWHILVPSEKVEKGSGQSKFNHFLLYKALHVTQPFTSCQVKVEDQFTVERNLVLGSVNYVGVPVAKRHGKTETGIEADENWLLIYKLFGKETVDERRDVKNQFGEFKDVRFLKADAFAIPSKALFWQELPVGD